MNIRYVVIRERQFAGTLQYIFLPLSLLPLSRPTLLEKLKKQWRSQNPQRRTVFPSSYQIVSLASALQAVCGTDIFCKRTFLPYNFSHCLCGISHNSFRRILLFQVNSWGSWGACSEKCAVGSKQRTRTVKISKRCQGRDCPVLQVRFLEKKKQKNACLSPFCEGQFDWCQILLLHTDIT